MDSFAGIDNFWDLSQHASSFSTIADDDFLALLQKQFPPTAFDLPPPDGVDPLSIGPLPIQNPSPPSTDSSPSPPSVNQEPSGGFSTHQRQQSSEAVGEDPSLKRKAGDEGLEDDQPHKSAHTDEANKKPASGPQRRKTTGNPQQDESRLLKRKEQNRAAQRAFRERKEKHVKDLEDKVAALEAKNQLAESENDNLRDLLSRLQSENMALKQAAFTFSVPKPNSNAAPNSFNHPQSPSNGYFSTPGASTSAAASSVSSPAQYPQMSVPSQSQQYEYSFGSLIPFDASMLDESSDAMNMDQPYGQGNTPYKTIASNPMFMSFGEPTPYDLSPPPMSHISSPPSTDSHPTPVDGSRMQSFSDWSQSPPAGQNMDTLDQLFGVGYHGAQSPVDITALLRSSPSSVSPISHASIRSNPGASPSSAPNGGQQNGSSSLTPPEKIHTREQCQAAINQAGPSPFVQESAAGPQRQNSGQYGFPSTNGGDLTSAAEACTRLPPQLMANAPKPQSPEDPMSPNGFVRKMTDPTGPMVMCKGSSFPKTEKSERNIEVLAAWRSITSNPQFKNVDINELCSEFTKKARCDGTKVVLEPEGVTDIIETLSVRRR